MSTSYSELEAKAVNVNDDNSVTPALDIKNNKLVCFGAKPVSGSHAAHVLTLQQSLDGASWANTSHTLNGVGITDNIQTAVKSVRVKCTTVEGSDSVVDIIIQAK